MFEKGAVCVQSTGSTVSQLVTLTWPILFVDTHWPPVDPTQYLWEGFKETFPTR
jgi:hypothetical protein